MSPSVSAVVINFNGVGRIEACLDSLRQQTRPPECVTVVDNASSDASLEVIASGFPGVKLIPSPRNLGYAAACNRGWRESPADLVAFLNNDLTLAPDWLERLLAAVTPPWGFWASRILFARDPQRVDSAGDAMAVVGAAYKIGHGMPASRFGEPREVFGACGAAALFRREVLEATGGFDEDLFLVHEDSDLNFRARLLGFRCLYVPGARVFHDVNRSIGTLSPFYVYYGHRNSEVVFWKNMPNGLLVRFLPERLLFNLFSFLYFLRRGRGSPFLKAKRDFLADFRNVLAKRRKIQASRRVGPTELRRLLDRNWLRHRLKRSP